jgi:hypothetical protein
MTAATAEAERRGDCCRVRGWRSASREISRHVFHTTGIVINRGGGDGHKEWE